MTRMTPCTADSFEVACEVSPWTEWHGCTEAFWCIKHVMETNDEIKGNFQCTKMESWPDQRSDTIPDEQRRHHKFIKCHFFIILVIDPIKDFTLYRVLQDTSWLWICMTCILDDDIQDLPAEYVDSIHLCQLDRRWKLLQCLICLSSACGEAMFQRFRSRSVESVHCLSQLRSSGLYRRGFLIWCNGLLNLDVLGFWLAKSCCMFIHMLFPKLL